MKNNNNQVMPAIELALQPSRLLLGILLLISMLACFCVIIVAIPFAIKLCLLTIIVFSTVYFVLRDALQVLPWSWQQLVVSSKGELRLINQRGQQFKPVLHASSFIHPWLVILNTSNTDDAKWFGSFLTPVLVLPRNVDQHRQLRVWLRWWKHHEGAA